jgi:hypothetical protein
MHKIEEFKGSPITKRSNANILITGKGNNEMVFG